MKDKSIKTLVGIGLAAIALAVTAAVALPSASQAQTNVPAATQTTAPTMRDGRGGPGGFERGGKLGGAISQYLADALGITTEALTAAQSKAQTAAVDEALAQGLITQSQANALKNGTRLGRGGRGELRGFLFDESKIDRTALLAKALNITTAELQAAEEKATDAGLAAAVTAGNLTQEQADLMKAQAALAKYVDGNGVYAQIVKQAVSAGAITQSQADAILAAQGTHGGMRGFGGPRGGHRGGGF